METPFVRRRLVFFSVPVELWSADEFLMTVRVSLLEAAPSARQNCPEPLDPAPQQVSRAVTSTISAELTLPEKILLAAAALDEAGQAPFSAEALIVSAWQKYPRTFGLKGYADQYPDSNKVLSAIMGGKGLANRGWLSKVGQKMYELSREGRNLVKRLLAGEELPPPSASSGKVKLSVEQENLLHTLLGSSAVGHHREGRPNEATFADACRFWNINNGMNAKTLDERLEKVKGGLALIERNLGQGSTTLRDGRLITREDVDLLSEVQDYLEQKFSRHLTLLRNRSERGD
jgi:hypothetical protein